ncbi:MAG: hypothetical protein PHS79_05195 [Patescibacteria group bacterium]|nr:hypothetical protein [Patescibacteria group bacterium]
MLLQATLAPRTLNDTGISRQEWGEDGPILAYVITGQRGSVRRLKDDGHYEVASDFVKLDSITILVRYPHGEVAMIHLPYIVALRLCCSFLAWRYSTMFADLIRGTILLPPELIPEQILPLKAMAGVIQKVEIAVPKEEDEEEDEALAEVEAAAEAPAPSPVPAAAEKGPDTMRGIGVAATIPPPLPGATADEEAKAGSDSQEQNGAAADSDFPVQTLESDLEDNGPDEIPQGDGSDSANLHLVDNAEPDSEEQNDDDDEECDPRWQDQPDDVTQVDESELVDSVPPAAAEESEGRRDSIVPMAIVEVGQAATDDSAPSAKSIRDARRAKRNARLAAANRASCRAQFKPDDQAEVDQIVSDAPKATLGDALKAKGQEPISVAPANGNNGEAPASPTSDEASPAS